MRLAVQHSMHLLVGRRHVAHFRCADFGHGCKTSCAGSMWHISGALHFLLDPSVIKTVLTSTYIAFICLSLSYAPHVPGSQIDAAGVCS